MGKLIKVTLSLVLVIAVIVIMNLGSGIKATVEALGPKITQSERCPDITDVWAGWF